MFQSQQQEVYNDLDDKKLPIIVDVAVDTSGNQLYQVHENIIRQDMPRTNNIDDNSFHNLENKSFTKESFESFASEDEQVNKGFSRVQDNDIWSDDVEAAFEEVLHLIPKNGLNKIKMAGRSCGRNELISDYIYSKIGKFRTRKQVSSHIQVIKNLGQNEEIIRLINEGPKCDTKAEQKAITKKFEEVFSEISLSKSLGYKDKTVHLPAGKRIRRRSSVKPLSSIKNKNFYMAITDQYFANPIILTLQDNKELKSFKLNDDAVIANRFPGLDEFKNSNIQIIHNMVNVFIPHLPPNYRMENFKSSLSYNYDDYTNKKINSSTIVYIYGNQQIRIDEENITLNQDKDFLIKFWIFFFSTLVGKSEEEQNFAFKGVTIKQIIYEPGSDPSLISKSKIRLILLWEYAKVQSFSEAITISRKLILPKNDNQPNQEVLQKRFQNLQEQSYYQQPNYSYPPPQLPVPPAYYTQPLYEQPPQTDPTYNYANYNESYY
ncbi:unnamed protein product [Candida verbasci]|uniref:TEA domain-containing protein n=1 Tax=Candida verbasci TaxID=1227364 RepID=A0A9W4XAP7_9ASCO|nr:unnamed protein product [Candida verbasci]